MSNILNTFLSTKEEKEEKASNNKRKVTEHVKSVILNALTVVN